MSSPNVKPEVWIWEPDLFFASRLRQQILGAGCEPKMLRPNAPLDADASRPPKLVVINLDFDLAGALGLLKQIHNHLNADAMTVLGHCGHLATEIKQQAEAAGCARVVTNGQLTGAVHQILAT